VPGEVALTIAVDVQLAHHPRPVDGRFPDPRVDGLAIPRDVAWEPDVDREQLCDSGGRFYT
jgi:hypothetical protein